MTTSDTTSFNLDIAELCEESFERCGKEMRSGYDLRTARRSLNLMTIEWANRGVNLWLIEQGTIPLIQGQSNYTLPTDTIDLLDHVVRTGSGPTQTDINISRISMPTYATIPNKTSQGRPIQVWIDRQAAAPEINIWPTPDNGNYTFVYWRLRRIQDTGTGGANTMDIPFRFLNCMVAGLAYYISMKLPDVPPDRVAMLKADYEEQFMLASQEDREKAPVRFVPRIFSPR